MNSQMELMIDTVIPNLKSLYWSAILHPANNPYMAASVMKIKTVRLIRICNGLCFFMIVSSYLLASKFSSSEIKFGLVCIRIFAVPSFRWCVNRFNSTMSSVDSFSDDLDNASMYSDVSIHMAFLLSEI
jgi:hypothetical protein